MAGSSIGTILKLTTWGESHGAGIGVVIDGCPAGLPLSEDDIQAYLDRRKPGQSRYTTQRNESDRAEILSGVYEGMTTGTPVSILVRNNDQHSKDYSKLKDLYRPGHADYSYDMKYGIRDHRGGGRSSGRETIGRVAGGAIAAKLLAELGISVTAYTKSIGPVCAEQFDPDEISRNPLCMPDAGAAEMAASYLEGCMEHKDSAGGVIECIVIGMPAGAGDPVFEKLDANLAKAVMSIGAVKAVEIGDGFLAAASTGSENNDPFIPAAEPAPHIAKASNHAGGILGGISDGSDIIVRAAVKPTPSIARLQKTVKQDGTPVQLEITGRHDPVIVPRAVVVVECMTALTVADALLTGMSAKLSSVKKIWGN